MSKRITAIAAGLTAFGLAYAYYIALHPFKPRLTWASVVIGDAATDIGASLTIWTLTRNWKAALVPWGAHALTGLPQIVVQLIKHAFMESTEQAISKYEYPA